MKYDEEKSSPSWHPYRYQVTDSSVMKSKQIFFTLSPDGLTQFALDNTTFIDLNRSDNSLSLSLSHLSIFSPRWIKDAELHEKIAKIQTFAKFRKWKSFKCWRNALSRHKFQAAKQVEIMKTSYHTD